MSNNKENLLLQVKNVTKRFGGVVAADNTFLEVHKNEVKGLIGPNGAGKTTLLNLISGITPVESGNIVINGVDVTQTPPHQRAKMGLARTFQTPRFLQRSTILENLMLSVDIANNISYTKSFFGKKGFDIKKETKQLMEIADFSFNWQDDINALPYGQRKLLEIVRSLLARPCIMLVDEPAAGLNSKEIEKAMALINFAAKKRNIGVVLIEHSMDMIMSICDRITVINFGKVICEGTPEFVSRDENVIEAYLGRRKDA